MTELRRWYFTTSLDGCTSLGELIRASVRAARRNTNLEPVCIHAGLTPEMRQFFAQYGVEEVEMHFPLIDQQGAALEGFEYWQRHVASGTYLKTLVPLVETRDEYVIYTDVDTLFLEHPSLPEEMPRFFAAAPEWDPTNWWYFNTGVMVMNIPNLRSAHDDFMACVQARINQKLFCTYEQGDMNAFYWMRWGRLKAEQNWKPYWGRRDGVEVVHFHGPKPTVVKRLLETGEERKNADVVVDWNPEGYRHFLAIYDQYASDDDDADPQPGNAASAGRPQKTGVHLARHRSPRFMNMVFPGDYWAKVDHPAPVQDPEPAASPGADFAWLIDAVRPDAIVEVGGWKGQAANAMADQCRKAGRWPVIVCVDTFLGEPEHWTVAGLRKLLSLKGGRPTLLEAFQATTMARGNTDMVLPFPIDAAGGAQVIAESDLRPDLVALDSRRDYESVRSAIRSYWPLLSERGVMFGDGYQHEPLARAVHDSAGEFGARVLVWGTRWLLGDQRLPETAAPAGAEIRTSRDGWVQA